MIKLRPYQMTGIVLLHRFDGRALLADEMGLGKTVQSLLYVHRHNLWPALVVCPAIGKWHWEDEAKSHIQTRSVILSGAQPPSRQRSLENWPPLTIINYDILYAWKQFLLRRHFQTLIIDEAQYIKNRSAQRTRAVHSLGRKIPKIIAMSGTPLTNRPAELFSILHLLYPDKFGDFTSFAWEFCNPTWTRWGWNYSGAKNLTKLHKLLRKTCMIRRTKSQVLKQLPEKIRTIIPLPIKDRSTYNHAERDFIHWLAQQSLAKARRAQRAEQLVRAGYLKRLAAQLKMPYICQWIDDFFEENPTEKLVVFGWQPSLITEIYNRYKAQAVRIIGNTSARDRYQFNKRFQQDPNCKLFVGQLIASGTVITLTAASNAAIFELDWVPGNHVQAEDRLHRMTQRQSVNIYYLVAQNTVEEKFCRLLQAKARIIKAVLDGEETTADELDIFDKLLDSLLVGRNIVTKK